MRARRSSRLPEYDYSSAGAYFFTVCTFQKRVILGEIAGESTALSPLGEIVRACWSEIRTHFPQAEPDAFVIMPNHIHCLIMIRGDPVVVVGARHASPLRHPRRTGQTPGSLSAIVGSLKSASARRINALRGTPGAPVWQRGFYDHVIRNDHDLARVREYIHTNPLRWSLDEENPERELGGLPDSPKRSW